MTDAFDQFWEWAHKRFESQITIPSDLHHVVMDLLSEGERHDRQTVNAAVEAYRNEKEPGAIEVALGQVHGGNRTEATSPPTIAP